MKIGLYITGFAVIALTACRILPAAETLTGKLGEDTTVTLSQTALGAKVLSPKGSEVVHEEWHSGDAVLLKFKPAETGTYQVLSQAGEKLASVHVFGPGLREIAFLLGGLAVFLYAMREISQSLRKAAGGILRTVLEKFAARKSLGAGVGVLLSVGVQSSTAATVMTVGLAAAGLMTLAKAVPIIIGASMGTVVTIQIIAFNLADYSLLIIAVGAALALAAPYRLWEYIGRVILGFGLIFLGMSFMRQGMAPLEKSPWVSDVLASLSDWPVLAFLCATVFTTVVQSSAATIALAMTLAAGGLMGGSGIVGMLLGAHLGTTITPLISAIGTSRIGTRVAVATFVYKAMNVLIALPLMGLIAEYCPKVGIDFSGARGVANAYSVLVLLWGILGLLVSGLIVAVVEKLVPEDTGSAVETRLDPALLSDPRSAITAVMMEAAQVASLIKKSAENVAPAVFDLSSVELEQLEREDELVDVRHKAAVRYVREIAVRELTLDEARSVGAVLYVLRDLEAMGDLISKDVVPIGYKRLNASKTFAMGDMAVIRRFQAGLVKALEQISAGLREAAKGGLPVRSGQPSYLLAQIQAHAAGISREVIEAHSAHFAAIASGVPEAAMDDTVFIDIIAVMRQLYSIAGDIAGVLVNPPEMTGFYHPKEKTEGTSG
jgi:phosphate:Na+ symporter